MPPTAVNTGSGMKEVLSICLLNGRMNEWVTFQLPVHQGNLDLQTGAHEGKRKKWGESPEHKRR